MWIVKSMWEEECSLINGEVMKVVMVSLLQTVICDGHQVTVPFSGRNTLARPYLLWTEVCCCSAVAGRVVVSVFDVRRANERAKGVKCAWGSKREKKRKKRDSAMVKRITVLHNSQRSTHGTTDCATVHWSSSPLFLWSKSSSASTRLERQHC